MGKVLVPLSHFPQGRTLVGAREELLELLKDEPRWEEGTPEGGLCLGKAHWLGFLSTSAILCVTSTQTHGHLAFYPSQSLSLPALALVFQAGSW